MPKYLWNRNYINICNTVKQLPRDKSANGRSYWHKHTFFRAQIGPKYKLSGPINEYNRSGNAEIFMKQELY